MLPTDPAVVLDRDQLRGITLEDEELMREVVAAVIEDTSMRLGRMAEAVRNQDAGMCASLAHYAKGACANIGANSLASALQQFERHVKAAAFGECARILETLARELDRLRAERV